MVYPGFVPYWVARHILRFCVFLVRTSCTQVFFLTELHVMYSGFVYFWFVHRVQCIQVLFPSWVARHVLRFYIFLIPTSRTQVFFLSGFHVMYSGFSIFLVRTSCTQVLLPSWVARHVLRFCIFLVRTSCTQVLYIPGLRVMCSGFVYFRVARRVPGFCTFVDDPSNIIHIFL